MQMSFHAKLFQCKWNAFLKVWDSNEVIQCLRKSAHFFFSMAWLIESLPSNSNILDAVIGTNQV